jgi:hypothetical protein
MDDPDLILIPEINAVSFFYFYFKPESVPALAAAAGGNDWKAALAIVERNAQRRYGDSDSGEIIGKTRTFGACIAKTRVMEARAAVR